MHAITTLPNAVRSRLHDRMPVMVPLEQNDIWLDPTASIARAEALLVPYPAEAMCSCAISRLVNSPRTDGPRVLEPLPTP